ncbi:MAG: UDP-N-acetylmuramoyl-L-alanyl-D-glutamate--2,6-diaminopimelate ligase, partial [Rhodothermales bacterium]|nr:UDP-N-acetylmuramoyl-L-alanyl-D-glutamate--2,6-diaminopimelate ligase [Rhodothermales bacterium]
DDSRRVRPNDCFVAVRGTQADGHQFIDKAVQNGATVIVYEAAAPDATMPPAVAGASAASGAAAFVRVADSRRARADLASLAAGDPADDIELFAVTGTNGKTTTTTLISQSLGLMGRKAGFIGTTGIGLSGSTDALSDASHTTPSALELYGLLADMNGRGLTACAMEASSHALDQHRLRVADVDVAVFTNLTRDHLDYHGSDEEYLRAKKRLFDDLRPGAHAVTNTDDPAGTRIVADTAAPVVTYGASAGADIRMRILGDDLTGLRLDIDGREGRFRLAGAFNAWNLTASYAALTASGVAGGDAFEALLGCDPVPGRFETIRFDDGSVVVIDYAHTPDALENILGAVRGSLPEGRRLWSVFGCGGDRDRGKRPLMASAAERLSDRVIATSDNPRTEDPEAILADVREGFARPEEATFIVDRAEAIAFAAEHMPAGDTLVLAGKGHEKVQYVKGGAIPFDERAIVRDAFSSHGRDEVRA